MRLVPPTDSLYLWAESQRSPAHVISLQIFEPPPDAGPELLDEMYAAMTDRDAVKPAFRRRPYRSAATAGQYAWAYDEDIDLALHVRRVALPRPGRIRELLEHVGDFHATLLARDRPLWQAHLVEGLADGRFALCTKMHHASFDGVNMARHVLGGLSPDPGARGCAAPWITPSRPGRPATPAATRRPTVTAIGKGALRVADQLGGTVKALAGAGVSSVRDGGPTLPFSAPHTILNNRVGSARRFAGDSWPIARLVDVARATGTSLNDVALTMCAGALRAYLIERDALPGSSLVAMVPVSLSSTDPSASARDGNSWAAVLCNLGTDIPDGLTRLRGIHCSMRRGKRLMSELDPVTATALSGAVLGGVLPNTLPGPLPPRPAFNLVISNVPAVAKPLYLNGCALTDAYPISVVTDGQALNITLVSYRDRLSFGITGCHRSVPHLQRLLVHLEDALRDLEDARPGS
ncbi:wax ester/triacylglycerol synthase family O-acyltransferase [Pseudonocardia eucalypti]|uniref:Diacylglycerol O-acyltransferase n=1 Tax=Pseudonocardia eucalypti TaxID=648755 RepID=A0ABP9PL09_9PSEU|nr:WS/DGAT/MGAT family acyltransferase [Pseudonocardia eucalypti]